LQNAIYISLGVVQRLLWIAVFATMLFVVGCLHEVIPPTSPEAERLHWLDHANVALDFRQHVEQQHDTRFLSFYGPSFTTEFPGLQDTAASRRLVREHGSRRIQGTTDIISSSEQQRLRHSAFEYARRYNSMLVAYLAAQ
jgi:hypothetical protein